MISAHGRPLALDAAAQGLEDQTAVRRDALGGVSFQQRLERPLRQLPPHHGFGTTSSR